MKRLNHFFVLTVLALSAALFAVPAAAQIAFVKNINVASSKTIGTSIALTVPAAGVAAGRSVIATFAMDPAAGTVSCSDTKGNTYTSNRDVTNGSGTSGVRTVVLSAHNVIALTSGNTITCTHPSVAARALSANEFSGLATSSTVDVFTSATGNSKSASSGNTATTQASELLIGGIGVEGPSGDTFTAGTNYTVVGRTGTTGANPATNITINPQYRIVSASGAYAATGTLGTSRQWGAAIVTYKAAPPVATKLVITSINGGSNPTAGVGFPVVVQSQSASGSPTNVISATAVSLSLKTGTGTLGGTLTGTIAVGTNQVTITGVTYTKAESGVVITATRTSGDSLTAGDSAPFPVLPGTASKVAFSTQPGNSTAGSPLSGPPTVVVQDSLGNTVTSSTASITVAIGTNPSGGTLSGTTPKSATAGVASFSDLSINKADTGYTLTASASGLTSATSSTFNIAAAAANKVAFTTQPANATAGIAIGGPPTVAVQDSFGNTITSSTASITVVMGTNPGGGTLSGTTPKTASSGVASFSDLSITRVGNGYTLVASATGLASATSSAFNISAGSAAVLAFTTQPGNAGAGSNISGPPTITVQDALGNTVSSSTASITVTIGTNPGGATLSGTTAKNASAGVATLTDLSIDKAGNGYTLTASATGLTGATSGALNISAGAASQVAFTTQPGSATAGTVIPGPTTATVQDSFGNTVTSSTATITVAIGSNPSGGTLFGTTTKNASLGVASFADLSIDKAGIGYTLTAAVTGLTSGTSSVFDVVAASASQIVFSTQPANSAAGIALGGPPTLSVQDSFGNTVTSSTASITVALGTNPGGSTLSGTATKNASSGVATFNDLSLNKPGSGYTLTASAAGLIGATSSAFNISAGAATALVFTTQPGSVVAGTNISGPPTVTVQDSLGNTVTSSTAAITVAIATNPSGGTLSGTSTKNAASGVASFNDLSINPAGNGYTLTASAAGLTGGTSSTFDLTASTGVSLAASPTSLAAGNPFTVTWAQIANPTPRDWIGLYTPGSSDSSYITWRYVSCTSSPNVVAPSGSCQFPTSNYLSADTYEFRLFSNGFSSYTRIATSNPVTVTPGLILTVSSSSVPAGATVIVAWSNNPNPSSTDYIRLTGSGGFVGAPIYVSCTQTPSVPLASGSCPYVLPASPVPATYSFQLFTNDTNTVIATSIPISVVPPRNLAIYANQNPTAGPPGFSLTVEAQTSSGDRANVLTDTAVSISLKAGTGVLSGTLTGIIPAGSSQVTIGLANYTKAESGVVVTATRTSGDALTAADSAPFKVGGGAPVSLVFVTQPGNTTAGSTISGPTTVAFQDVLGNVTSSAAPVTVAIGTNPSGGTLSGNMTVTTTSSVAFTTLSINQPGIGYTLTVSSAGVVGATSNPFNITSSGGGGIIAGVVTRVSNGATITGALVEAFQGTALRGSAVSNSTGNYSIAGLATGSYTVRASFTGLVPQMVSNVSVIDGSTTTVPLSLNFGIAVQSPVAGATVNDFSLLVTGLFDKTLASEVGITVNGYVALQDGNEFASLIPIDSQTTTVTATLKDPAGTFIAGDAVPITAQLPNTAPLLFFRPSPVLALVSQPIGFTLTSVNPFTQIQLDGNGDGTSDYTGSTLQGITVTFAESGLYFPTVSVTEEGGTVRTATTLVQVFDATQLDMLLQNKWTAMKNALRQGDVTGAASHIVMRRRATYAAMLNALTVPLSSIDQVLTSITLLEQRGSEAEYEMLVNEGGSQRSYMVLFAIDEDGVWRVKFF